MLRDYGDCEYGYMLMNFSLNESLKCYIGFYVFSFFFLISCGLLKILNIHIHIYNNNYKLPIEFW